MTAAERLERVGKLRPQLVRFARTRLRNPVQVEDAVQETLLAAVESIESFSGGSSLYSWLTGILKHKIVDCVKRSARDAWEELDGESVPGDASDGPEGALARRRLWAELIEHLERLPPRMAENFVLRQVLGLSTAEASRALAVSETHCCVMLHRARGRIRGRLGPQWIET